MLASQTARPWQALPRGGEQAPWDWWIENKLRTSRLLRSLMMGQRKSPSVFRTMEKKLLAVSLPAIKMFKISSFNPVLSWRRIGLSKGLKGIYNKAHIPFVSFTKWSSSVSSSWTSSFLSWRLPGLDCVSQQQPSELGLWYQPRQSWSGS